MTYAIEVLNAKKREMLDEIKRLKASVSEINTAINLIDGRDSSVLSEVEPSAINEIIVKAIGAGCKTPSDIHNYLIENNIDTTKNSISTRLTKLKGDKKIDRNQDGWFLPTIETKKAPGIAMAGANSCGVSGGPQSAASYPAPSGSIPVHSIRNPSSMPLPGDGTPNSNDMDDEIPF